MRETKWIYDRKKWEKKCFGALALPAESKKHDLLSSRETKCALTSWGRAGEPKAPASADERRRNELE